MRAPDAATDPDGAFARYRACGDSRALAAVFDAVAPELLRIALHLTQDRHAAEDLVQSTFLVAIEDRARWDQQRGVVPWLLGILANRARRHRREQARARVRGRSGPAHAATEGAA